MNTPAQFPPLLSGRAIAGQDPFAVACAAARTGSDAGLVVYDTASGDLSAAIVFAPEVTLARAAAMLPLCALGLQNALGALAPPELPVHLDWDGGIRVNGGRCGALRIAASSADPDRVPDWIVIGLFLRFVPGPHDPGETPEDTALYGEGCGDLAPRDLLESWARHVLNWIHRWEGEGVAPLHKDWSALLQRLGQPVRQSGREGTFVGLDEQLGMLLKSGDITHLVPLTDLLEPRP